LRKYLERHMQGDCSKRGTKCPHCGKDFNHEILQTHYGNCPRYPIGCPNRCDVMKIPREELEVHMKEHCKSALVACPFKEVGCKHKCPRYHIDKHLAEANLAHMKSMFDLVKTQQQQISTLESQIAQLSVNTTGELLWRIDGYSKRFQSAQKDEDIEITSPAFYTHRHGYKLQLSAFLNGNGSGLNTHVSLYIRVLPGEYDSLLEWPFTHDVTFRVLDQGDPLSSKRQHITVRFSPDPTWKNFQQPKANNDDDSTLGFGYPKFVSHKELKDHNYLMGNNLYIKASVDTSRIVIP